MSLMATTSKTLNAAMPSVVRGWISPIAASCCFLAAGCATVDPPKSSHDATAQNPTSGKEPDKSATKSFNDQRDLRRKQVVAEFDRQRDRAEYQAALNDWERGDAVGARETLAPVLARNPDYREAHLLAAQLDLFENKPKAALAHARYVLVAHPNDPQAHFEAALALDAMGAATDALPHYENAARLAPHEEAYQVSYQTALTAVIPPPVGRDVSAAASSSAARSDGAGSSAASDDGARIGNLNSAGNL